MSTTATGTNGSRKVSPNGINSGGIFFKVRRRWEMVCAEREVSVMRSRHDSFRSPSISTRFKNPITTLIFSLEGACQHN
jgi:hypothetical protein